jgi:REP element-mobilizing transposase RayT
VHFNFWLKTKSRQWVFAGDLDAAVRRAIKGAGEERRINLLEWEATLDHMRLRIGARDGGRLSRMMHLLSGASARVKLRAASDLQLEGGLSHFWQQGQGSQPLAPGAISAVRRTGGDISKDTTGQSEPFGV